MLVEPGSTPGWEDPHPAEEGMATHSPSFLEKSSPQGRKVRYDRANSTLAYKGKLEQSEEQLETHL